MAIIELTDRILKSHEKIKTKEVLCLNQFPIGHEFIKEQYPMCLIPVELPKDRNRISSIQNRMKFTLSHYKIALALDNGETKIDTTEIVMHLCGNHYCLNPKHLKKGTDKENMSHKKVHNTNYSNRRLSLEEVKEIREWYNSTDISQKEVATKYKLSQRVVSYIVSGHAYPDPTYKQTRIHFKNGTGRKGNLPEEKIKRVCQLLNQQTLSNVEIAKALGLTTNQVGKINQGLIYKDFGIKYLDPNRNVFKPNK